MPITLPNLDDRRYADLVDEALAIIPVHAPEWTNHNPSDPGITLVELFAYVTEMLIYRLNRVTVENVVAFLNLIDEGKRSPRDYRDRDRLTEEVRKVVMELRKPYRTVTHEDFNKQITGDFSKEVARVFTTTLRQQRSDNRTVDFTSVFVVPVLRTTVLVKRREETSDHSSDLRSPGNIGFRLISEPGEYLYIGMKSEFDAIKFSLRAAVSGYKLKFEYSMGGDEGAEAPEARAQWASLNEKDHKLTDLTSNWASSGLVAFTPPPDWKQSTVNQRLMYWVRVSANKPAKQQADASAFQVAVQSVPKLEPDASDQSLPKRIKNDLDNRRLLTTRLSVAGPQYKKLAVQGITLNRKPDALDQDVVKAAKEELSRFFHPLIGGRDGQGWPFGRAVYLSEIIERLAGLPGVEFVESGAAPVLLIDKETGKPTPQPDDCLKIEPFELVDFRISDSQFKTRSAPDPRALRQSK